MTKASMNAKLQSRTGARSDAAKLLADAEFVAIRARIQSLPRGSAERRALIARKYDRELEVLGA